MRQRLSKITEILVLSVFLLLALSVILVVLTGAESYRKLVSEGEMRYETRTALGYVTTRVRQAEQLRVEVFGGCQTLVTEETVDGTRYLTRIYWYDGFLRELFSAENADLAPEDGEKVLETGPVGFDWEQDFLRVTLNGQERILSLEGKG